MEKGTEIWGVKMVSDCMEPTIPKGATAILDRSLEVRDGDVAFAGLSEGRSYLRRCYDVGDRYRLVAEKPGEDSPEVVEVDKSEVEVLVALRAVVISYVEPRRIRTK